MVVKWTQQVPKNRHIYTDLLQTEFKANMVFSHSLLVLVPQRSGLYQHDPYSSNKCCPFGQETDPLTSAMLAWLTLWHTIKLPSAFAPCFKQDRWAAPQKRGSFWCIMKRKPWDSNLPLQPSDHQPYPVTSKARRVVSWSAPLSVERNVSFSFPGALWLRPGQWTQQKIWHTFMYQTTWSTQGGEDTLQFRPSFILSFSPGL